MNTQACSQTDTIPTAAVERIVRRMLIAETELPRQRIQQLEALLNERGSKCYMTISEIEKRYRRNRRRVLTDMHTGLVQFVKREKSRAGKPIYLVREDEAERAWGCGSPV